MEFKMDADRDINLKLALEVEQYPCLYNFKLPEYCKKEVTEKAWVEVGKRTNLTVHECKEKWKNIRSAFVRSLKPSPGLSLKTKRPYYLHDYLRFIVPFVKTVNSIEAVKLECPEDYHENNDLVSDETEEQEIFEEVLSPLPSISNDDSQLLNAAPPTILSSTKRKKRKLDSPFSECLDKRQLTIDDETAIRYFLLSLIPDLNGLSETQLRQFKIKSLLLINDLKEQTDSHTENAHLLT